MNGWTDELVLKRLYEVASVAGRIVVRLCEGGYGISRRQWAILAMLGEHPEGLQPSRLAELLGLDRTRVSRVITTLVEAELVRRSPAQHRQRGAVLHLTEAGRDIVSALKPQILAVNQQLLSVLSPAEAEGFFGTLRRLHTQSERLLMELGPELPKAHRQRGRPTYGAPADSVRKRLGG